MSRYVPMENQPPFYYSLSRASNIFGLTFNEIIDLAIKNDIILSIKIPKDYFPYLLSVVPPEDFKMFGYLTHTKKALQDTSMLPVEIPSSYVNLSVSDCCVLKTSNLEQSIFESVFMNNNNSYSEHELLSEESKSFNYVRIGDAVVNNFNYHTYKDESINLKTELTNNFSPENILRIHNGLYKVLSNSYIRKVVLIDGNSTLADAGVDDEFLASSNLNQCHIKELTITQNDIEISSNYKEVFEQLKAALTTPQLTELKEPQEISEPQDVMEFTVDDIPKESDYFLPKRCRYSSKLNLLAVLGYSFYESKSLTIPSNLTSYFQNKLSNQNIKEAQTAVFFINPKPAGKMRDDLRGEVQFKSLIAVYEKFYIDGKLKSNVQKTQVAQKIKRKLNDDYGYSREKCRYAVRFITPDNKK
jgi:hypothetical protein